MVLHKVRQYFAIRSVLEAWTFTKCVTMSPHALLFTECVGFFTKHYLMATHVGLSPSAGPSLRTWAQPLHRTSCGRVHSMAAEPVQTCFHPKSKRKWTNDVTCSVLLLTHILYMEALIMKWIICTWILVDKTGFHKKLEISQSCLQRQMVK